MLAVSRALIADPEREGMQLIARSDDGEAVGFATVYWSWDTLIAARVGIMHDLFVIPPARGTGIADLLIDACVEECRRHGAAKLGWQTAPDNTSRATGVRARRRDEGRMGGLLAQRQSSSFVKRLPVSSSPTRL